MPHAHRVAVAVQSCTLLELELELELHSHNLQIQLSKTNFVHHDVSSSSPSWQIPDFSPLNQ